MSSAFIKEVYLSHHGIPGQKWGKKNGPPYPLNYTDLSEEEKGKAKSKAIREGNINEAAANKDHFSDAELKQVKERFKLNQEINSLSKATIKTGADRMDDIMKTVGKVTTWTTTGINAYNTVAKIANSLGDTNLALIKDSKPDNGRSFVDKVKLADGTERTITVNNASVSEIKDMSGYYKKGRK